MKFELDRKGEILALFIITVLSLFFRLYRLDDIPAGLLHDEAAYGADTTSWVTGEIIADRYEIRVDPQAGAGQYVVEVGMYLGETGKRLSVYNIEGELAGDRILLPLSIEVQR